MTIATHFFLTKEHYMLGNPFKSACLTCLLSLWVLQVFSATGRFRIAWEEDPATTAVIAWDQLSGSDPVLYLDVNNYGQNFGEYAVAKRPQNIIVAKGMNNHFIHLQDLVPNTTYYFIIKDSEGVSRQLFFSTAPNRPDRRLSIIAGGDSRNFREARRDANLLVGKLRPHCVMFGGDFTEKDSPDEWKDWFDDWQLTISKDGRMTPIVVTRGNHEESNRTLNDLFGIRSADLTYAFNLGGNLLRIYTLNTLIPISGSQQAWLESDLRSNTAVQWKFAQYHQPMRPHTKRKMEKNDQVVLWAPLFYKYGINLVVECDAHVVKSTWPIRPDNGPGSYEGFIRDDDSGTVFVGEGCWGAPLRNNDDDKPWTRASDSFNQFNWIFVDQEKIEVRTIKTDGADRVADINPNNIFSAPRGLVIWNPENGDVITIQQRQKGKPAQEEEIFAARSGVQNASMFPPPPPHGPVSSQAAEEEEESVNWEEFPTIMPDDASGDLLLKYNVEEPGNVVIRLINLRLQEVTRLEIPNQAPGEYLKTIKTSHLKPGRYLAIVKGNRKILRRFRVTKR